MSEQTHDPIGPGTPAWEAFDAAVECLKQAEQFKADMVAALRAAGRPDLITEWLDIIEETPAIAGGEW